jgi:4-hydroxybenzoate polyprenyltransferase
MVLPLLKNLLLTMRPKQWPKNGFLFAALIFDRQLLILPAFLHILAGFILFCLLSGAVYIINDIVDLEADRLHPQKRMRPLASGKLSIPVARSMLFVILITALPLAYWLSPTFAVWGLVYFLLNLVYSRWFKHIPIIDVLALASFYVIRVEAGVVLIQVTRFSPWLYIFTTFLALFLGIGKRRAELSLLTDVADAHRKVLDGYSLPYLDQLLMIVSGMTIITYSLYTFTAPYLQDNHALMLTIPFLIYGIFRYLYLIQLKQGGGAPEDILFTDQPLQLALVLFGLTVVVVFYLL